MSLFQHTILKKQIAAYSDKIEEAYKLYVSYFLNPEVQENIRNSKEEQFQEGFLRELFVKILGYILNPDPDYNLITEKKNETNAKKADGAIVIKGEVRGVIELKDHKTTDLKQVESQAFGYKNNNRNTSYVVISNFEKLRFYIDNTVDFEEFNLFALSADDFAVLWICLAYENIARDLPKQLKNESANNEELITKQLYKDYSAFKQALFSNIVENNTQFDKLTLFKKTQKLLDRLLFIFFAEDCNLLPPNSMSDIIFQWENLKDMDAYTPLYERIKKYFGYMNTGFKGKKYDVFAYNGGLFKPDEVLDNVIISDEVLRKHSLQLSQYDFASEVDVNILGHIFEHSLTEIDEIAGEITRGLNPLSFSNATSKRKKDGVFYTPRYITKYIVENTLGKLCTGKKAELSINESEYFLYKKRAKSETKALSDKLNIYREWLLSLTICDPACGSGAFLNAALDYLIAEHKLVDELTAKIFDNSIVFPNIENAILENNLYGVDINEESVEIAKLALWLRTAKPQRKLNSLNNNIKCGNSLISPDNKGLQPLVIEKAFNWYKEFPQVFKEKDKIAFHVTTAIHDSRTSQRMIDYNVREKRFNGTLPNPQIFPLDAQDELIITKTIAEIVQADNLNVLAYNICRDHLHIIIVCESEELDNIVRKLKGKSSQKLKEFLNIPKDDVFKLWTQKFGYKEIINNEQLYNTIEYIETNRIKHELPDNKGLQPLVNTMLCTIDHAFRPEYKGGFDVVIGNPPYVLCQPSNTPENILNYYKQFEVASYKIDLFHLFFEQGIKLLKANGKLGYITPNTYLTNKYIKPLRAFILNNTDINYLVQHDETVFVDASVDVATIILSKQKEAENNILLLKSSDNSFIEIGYKNQKDWNKDADCIFNIKSDFNIDTTNCVQLGEICNTYFGIQAFDRKSSISNKKGNDHFLEVIDGGDIYPYSYAIPTKYFNYIDSNIKSGGDWKVYERERIVVRQIGQIPIVGMSRKDILASNTLYSVYPKTGDYKLQYVLCILNSSVIKKYWLSKYSDSKQLFPKIKGYQLRELPIKAIQLSDQ
ncbi:MAG: Modification methylase TaqI [Candidatus Ordinivivax streblomastigis]|uniref:site-specific DNA-methyltransferase (adenine-specific) n=1 Tax=Candidatus Ordinivivax streblomastigis TaxID=2540710 RepID=A0A5M8P370_9BACT|nr:MAG: Modification methylase TaqI [Candidatus Ordinivivax streblomastigis]